MDSNVLAGKRGLKHRRELWRSEDILRVMDQCGVAAALVCSGWAKDYAPEYGNRRLREELAKSDRFYGCYTVMPGGLGDFPSPEAMVRELRDARMAAAKMYPQTHKFLPDEVTMGPYYKALEDARVPLLVDSREIRLSELGAVLERYPALAVILQGASWSDERALLPYMQAYPNLYAELSNLQANFVVETLAEKVGAQRLIFGSGMPRMSLGAARALIDYAELTDGEKQLIAGGNLARLCGIPLPEPAAVHNDSLAQEASEGAPLHVCAFDSHSHFLEDGGSCGGGIPMIRGDLENLSALNARLGVGCYCVAPWLGIWTDSEEGNRLAAQMAAQDPRVCPYVLIDPNYVEDIAAEARRCHLELKMPGVKMFYSRTQVRYNDPVFEPWWQIAEENRLFALMDPCNYAEYYEDVEALIRRYPNVSFFLDHAGRSFEVAEICVEYAQKYANAYLQLTYTTVPQGMIEYLCGEGLADRTLYGTDAPMRDPRPQLGWVAYADVSEEDKAKILGGNMRKIHARCFSADK